MVDVCHLCGAGGEGGDKSLSSLSSELYMTTMHTKDSHYDGNLAELAEDARVARLNFRRSLG